MLRGAVEEVFVVLEWLVFRHWLELNSDDRKAIGHRMDVKKQCFLFYHFLYWDRLGVGCVGVLGVALRIVIDCAGTFLRRGVETLRSVCLKKFDLLYCIFRPVRPLWQQRRTWEKWFIEEVLLFLLLLVIKPAPLSQFQCWWGSAYRG